MITSRDQPHQMLNVKLDLKEIQMQEYTVTTILFPVLKTYEEIVCCFRALAEGKCVNCKLHKKHG